MTKNKIPHTSKQKNKNRDKDKDKHKKKAGITLAGTLDITRSGMGYVVLKEPGTKDILVRPQDMHTALDGDTVEVKITKMSPNSDRREGRITKVISRRQTEFIGSLSVSDNYAFFIASGDKPMPDIYIPKGKFGKLPDNSRVIVRLVEWENKEKKPVGEVVTVVDTESENDFAMNALLNNSGFTVGFPDEVMAEADTLADTIPAAEIKLRRDFRKTLTFTIDPADAKDFDDAISYKKIDRNWFEIGVHIADVSHYVTADSALDKEAYRRATSVYLPDRVNPMLPEHISNVLCSLRPNEDKLCFSAVFTINKEGKVKDSWIGKTLIHSDQRYAYEDVQAIIEGGDGPNKPEILWLNEMTQILRKERFAKGAINFSSQEVKFKLDEKGKPIGIEIKESKPAHQLIEELMLLANKTVAEYASKVQLKEHKDKPLPFPYRVHDQPDEDKFASFVPFARKYGYQFDVSSPQKIAESFNTMLQKAQGKPEQHLLEQLGIRTMAKAIYTSENIGHYGLGFEDYCHFTSPIRRYPDVMVHRILESCLQGHPIFDKKLEEKCKHCSDRERAAMECERASNKYKQVEYMQQFLGETFPGVVSGVAEFGFWVETINEKCEGLVSVHSLSEPFAYVATEYMLQGEITGKRIQMGDTVEIQVVAANLEKRQLDYRLITNEPVQQGPKSNKKPRTRTKRVLDNAAPQTEADRQPTPQRGRSSRRPKNDGLVQNPDESRQASLNNRPAKETASARAPKADAVPQRPPKVDKRLQGPDQEGKIPKKRSSKVGQKKEK